MNWKEANEKIASHNVKNMDNPICVEVSDDYRQWHKLVPILFTENFVLCVTFHTTDKIGVIDMSTFNYNYWRPIPEKTKRLLTVEELLQKGARFVHFGKLISTITGFKLFEIEHNAIWSTISFFKSEGFTWSTDGINKQSFEIKE